MSLLFCAGRSCLLWTAAHSNQVGGHFAGTDTNTLFKLRAQAERLFPDDPEAARTEGRPEGRLHAAENSWIQPMRSRTESDGGSSASSPSRLRPRGQQQLSSAALRQTRLAQVKELAASRRHRRAYTAVPQDLALEKARTLAEWWALRILPPYIKPFEPRYV